jgi:3',5'-cyclic-AMP phosphodiesterase
VVLIIKKNKFKNSLAIAFFDYINISIYYKIIKSDRIAIMPAILKKNFLTMLTVAQITDTHIFADDNQEFFGINTTKSLISVVSLLKSQPPVDLLLLTGDLSQDETPQSYQVLRDLISPLQIPTYYIPGNHDQPDLMSQVFHQDPFHSAKSFIQGGWQFILLSTQADNCVQGKLSPQTLIDLEQQLQNNSDRPTIIVLHHHPILINSQWMDNIMLEQPQKFLDIIDRHPQVKIVLFGHIHQEFEKQRQNVHYLGCPSTCIQFQPNQPKMLIDDQKPALRILKLHPEGTFTSQIHRVC